MKFDNKVKEILEWCGCQSAVGMPQSRTAGPSSDGPPDNPNGYKTKEFVITNGIERKSFDTAEERDEFMANNYGWKPVNVKGDSEEELNYD